MTPQRFTPTDEQLRIIGHEGDAFVSACPGSGKTRVLVERARLLLKGKATGRGIAFLSFTKAAMSEFDRRLRQEGLLPSLAFPHFVGTFDSFLWQFLVAPLGIPGCELAPRIIPDKDDVRVRPSETLRGLPLRCFDRVTGEVVRTVAKELSFDPAKNPRLTRAYMTIAAETRRRFLKNGQLDFDDVRLLAAERLTDTALSSRLAAALAGRFREVIVDEAQDCNPADLQVIEWLRDAGIRTKVVCDPYQSIFEFRGGVTEELITFGQAFEKDDHLSMNGNFRSSEPICKAISALRPSTARARPDRALGEYAAIPTPVHILAYSGSGVPPTLGKQFRELVEAEGIGVSFCPVLAATRHTSARAIGQPSEASRHDLTLRLANAVTSFYLAFETGNRVEALEEVHRVVLDIEDQIGAKTYHQYLAGEGVEPRAWRPAVLKLMRDLRYDRATCPDADTWLARARSLLAPHLPDKRRSINQKFPRNARLAEALVEAPAFNIPAKTIHSVKGMEFPAVCVVMTVKTVKGILDYLETGVPVESAEEARKIYVAASRAQRLLAIATPKGQAARLEALLTGTGAAVSVLNV